MQQEQHRPRTWRELLNSLDTQEKRRIITLLGIQEKTLERWISGKTELPRMSKIGTVKLHLHRNLEGTIKTLTIKCEGEHWYAVFTCEIGTPKALPVSCEEVGIDLGVTHFATLSTGEFIDNPRYFRRGQKTLTKRQAAASKKKRGSHRWKKAMYAVKKAHRTIRNQRHDFLHKQSRQVVNRFQLIAVEDLQIANLLKRPKPKQDK